MEKQTLFAPLKKIQIKKNKKGQLGLNVVKSVMLALLTLAVIYIAVVLALVSLRDSNIFTAGSPEEVDVNNTILNITQGGADFFDDVPTIFAILVVVVIILAIGIIISVVSRFGGTGGAQAGL